MYHIQFHIEKHDPFEQAPHMVQDNRDAQTGKVNCQIAKLAQPLIPSQSKPSLSLLSAFYCPPKLYGTYACDHTSRLTHPRTESLPQHRMRRCLRLGLLILLVRQGVVGTRILIFAAGLAHLLLLEPLNCLLLLWVILQCP